MSTAEDQVRELVTAENGTIAMLNASEIDRQIATARKYPRSISQSRCDILELVTLNEEVARECIYALPRKQDGKRVMIEGPSARFAEILAHSWGNARAGARVVDEQGDFVTAQGVFHDLEKNVAITYEVKRRIVNRDGHRFNADMIGVTANAACSIALRNAVLKGVPKALWAEAYASARQVIMGDAKTLNTRRSNALGIAQKFGLDADQVCAVLGVNGVDDIGLEELAALHGVCGALRDGETTVERLLEESGIEPQTRASSVSGRIRKPKESPETESPPADPQPTSGQSAAPQNHYVDRLTLIKDADSIEELDRIQRMPSEGLTDENLKSLDRQIISKRQHLSTKR